MSSNCVRPFRSDRSCPEPASIRATPQGRPISHAHSICRSAIFGFVVNSISSGTPAFLRLAASLAHFSGSYSWRRREGWHGDWRAKAKPRSGNSSACRPGRNIDATRPRSANRILEIRYRRRPRPRSAHAARSAAARICAPPPERLHPITLLCSESAAKTGAGRWPQRPPPSPPPLTLRDSHK